MCDDAELFNNVRMFHNPKTADAQRAENLAGGLVSYVAFKTFEKSSEKNENLLSKLFIKWIKWTRVKAEYSLKAVQDKQALLNRKANIALHGEP